MIDVRVRHRADDCQPVGSLGEQRKMLADLGAGHAGGDRLELAADLCRRRWLQIPGLLLGRATPHEEQNAAFRSAETGVPDRSGRGSRTPAQESGSARPNSPRLPARKISRRLGRIERK